MAIGNTQLLVLIKYGFPLDFNHACDLDPKDIEACNNLFCINDLFCIT